jgi:type II secretory ATPase GspE/PulE/Tfp pilus assembly ATPase PilB-like protein
MGIAQYDLDECLRAVIAQRLVRLKTAQGYQGRTGIFECYQPNQSYQSLQEVGAIKIKMGLTTDQEIQRVL